MMHTPRGYREFRTGWPLVLSAMVGVGLGLSPVPFYTIGMLAPELAKAFGWGFTQIQISLLITTLTVLVASPLAGFLADRIGVRRVALGSVALFSLTFMSFALSTGSLPQFYATWAILAFVGAGTLPITWTRAVNNRFEERKGLALGLCLLGTGIFGFAVKPLTAWLIAHFGWRSVYLVVGALPLLLAWPLAFVAFHDVARPTGGSPADRPDAPPGLTFAETLREWRFWLLGAVFVPISFAIGGPIPNMENILRVHGFERSQIVPLVSLIGLSVIVGRVVGGWLIDRFWAPAVAVLLLSAPAFSCHLLASGEVTMQQAALAICLIGGAAGVEYDLMAFLVARYFGMRSYSAIYGALYGFFAFGAGIAPAIFARDFDRTHGYGEMLSLASIILVGSALLLLTLGRYRQFGSYPQSIETISTSVPSGSQSVPESRSP
jgi:MFS family permease